MGLFKHGEAPKSNYNGTRLYGIWNGMKVRCYNPNRKDYRYYGGKGIKVCDEWSESYKTFKNWALTHGYSEELTIDRIDSDLNYSPENCRWVDRIEQSRNLKRTRLFTYKGETKTASEWSKIYGISSRAIRHRIDSGWSIEQALNEPLQKGKKTVAHSRRDT